MDKIRNCPQCKKDKAFYRAHKGGICADCYNYNRTDKICKTCGQNRSIRWYKGPICAGCHKNTLGEKTKKIEHTPCIICKTKYSSQWHKQGQYCVSCYKKLFWYDSIRTRYSRSKRNAELRKKDWEISFEFYKEAMQKNCTYCFKKIDKEIGVGLDRVNNTVGYLENNVLSCCGDCNKMRGEYLTVDEMKFVRHQLEEFRKKNDTT